MKKKALRPPSQACPRLRTPFIWLLTLGLTEQLFRRNRKGLVGQRRRLPSNRFLIKGKCVPEGPPKLRKLRADCAWDGLISTP